MVTLEEADAVDSIAVQHSMEQKIVALELRQLNLVHKNITKPREKAYYSQII